MTWDQDQLAGALFHTLRGRRARPITPAQERLNRAAIERGRREAAARAHNNAGEAGSGSGADTP